MLLRELEQDRRGDDRDHRGSDQHRRDQIEQRDRHDQDRHRARGRHSVVDADAAVVQRSEPQHQTEGDDASDEGHRRKRIAALLPAGAYVSSVETLEEASSYPSRAYRVNMNVLAMLNREFL